MPTKWQCLVGFAGLLLAEMAAGCGGKAHPPSSGWDHQSIYDDPSPPLERELRSCDDLKGGGGGVLYSRSPAKDPPTEREAFRPEVLIVVVNPNDRTREGDLILPVQQLKYKLLKDTDKCKSELCAQMHSLYGEQYTIARTVSTGTFIDQRHILTAQHHLRSTDWTNTYAIMGFYGDHRWEIFTDRRRKTTVMKVPKENTVKLCHVVACEKHKGRSADRNKLCDPKLGCDLALVHVCDESTFKTKVRSLPSIDRPPSTTDLKVYSHAWGLPLKEYAAVMGEGPNLAHFSNASGGSGAAVVNGDGVVVGVVHGDVSPIGSPVQCTGPGDGWCDGQPITPHDYIVKFVDDKPICKGLRTWSNHNTNSCSARTSAQTAD